MLHRIDDGVGDAGLAPGASSERGAAALEGVHDLVEVGVPRSGRAVVVSDLHLTGTVTTASRGCTNELIKVLSAWTESGTFVIAGDGFEQLHEPVAPLEDILDAHDEWTSAVRAFADDPDHHVIVLSGNHDGNIAWDPAVVEVLQRRLGADFIALAADLVVETGEGSRRVHVVHGNQDDKYNAFVDRRSPIDTPTGHHVVRQVLPELDRVVQPGGLLDGLTWLAEPMQAGEMVGSRLLYRQIGRHAWLLAVPFVVALALRGAALLPGVDLAIGSDVEGWLIWFGFVVLALLAVALIATALTLLGVHSALTHTDLSRRSGVGAHNAVAREHAARIVELGYAGMISGHTHQPELTTVNEGFYANSGCGVEVVGPRPAKLGLPRPFAGVHRITRVEVLARERLEVRLVVADVPLPVRSLLERIVSKPDRDTPTSPSVVASLPAGATWPVDRTTLGTFALMRRARRRGAGLLLLVALLDLVTSFAGPSLHSFALFSSYIPDRLPHAASFLLALISIAFIALARGVRRGYRQTWAASVVLLVASVVVLVIESVDFELVVVNLVVALVLFVDRRHFTVLVSGRRRWLLWTATLSIAAIALVTTLALILDEGTGERVTGVAVSLALGLVIWVALAVQRPVEDEQRVGGARRAAEHEARVIIGRTGGDTFDHSAIRADKALLFTGEGLVAYKVIDEWMAVSPDPICAVEDRAAVWASAMDYADTHGWRIAVLGASATWLPIYHASGLYDVYLGDEALVDCARFASGVTRPLRRAVAEATGRGFAVTMIEAAALGDRERARLEELITGAEIGAPGHGFATSIGRLATPDDTGALLALCHSNDGVIAAFDQFLPVPLAGGYVLDASCTARLGSDATVVGHLLLVESLRWMCAHDVKTLSLGLAASGEMRGGASAGVKLPIERRVLAQFAGSDELERRRDIDREYEPLWRPRYVINDTMRSAWAGHRSLDAPDAVTVAGASTGIT